MNDTRKADYSARFRMVCHYIERHLDEPLSLEALSAIAHCSPFHFHRMFTAWSGLPLYRYIQWLRLRHASWRLAFNPHDKIIDIALDAGFQNPESFSRAFKTALGASPRQFRREPDWVNWHQRVPKNVSQERTMKEINIVVFPTTPVAMLKHRGDPAQVNASAATFIEWRRSSGLSPVERYPTYGIAWDDPESVPADAFRFDICAAVEQAVPANTFGVENGEIPGGRCAVIRHHGSLDSVGESVYHLFRHWLPESGETVRDFPVFFHYLNFVHQVPEHELKTDIYLPLA